jgi:DNA invertase Pin-like site-specific DNA recombinase
MFAHNLITFAQYERELIGERTKAALAAKKARNEPIGRPREASTAVVRRIVADRDSGSSFDAIAKTLEAEGTRSPRGGDKWHSSTVRRIYQSAISATKQKVSA